MPDRHDPGGPVRRALAARPSPTWPEARGPRTLPRLTIAVAGDIPTVDEAGAPGLHISLWNAFGCQRGRKRMLSRGSTQLSRPLLWILT
jgi:hypothetical protein